MAGVWLPVALVLLQGGLASPVRLQEVTLDRLVRDAAPDVFNRMGRLDPAYTNPCFQSHIDGSLKCMAYFNILGVAKSGTSDLYAKLAAHPQVVDAKQKEPFYWSERRESFDKYLDNFKPCADAVKKNPRLVTGEGSTETFPAALSPLWMNPVDPEQSLLPMVLKAAQQQLKPIVNLREPVERLYSAYWFFGCAGWMWPQDKIWTHTGPRSAQEFHRYATSAVRTVQECLARWESIRTCYRFLYTSSAFHLLVGVYAAVAPDWLRVYSHTNPREISFVNFDTYKQNETAILYDLFDFLGLDIPTQAYNDKIATIMERRGHPGNSNIGGCQSGWEPMLEETRMLLQDFYEPYNSQLADMLGDDSYRWEYQKRVKETRGEAMKRVLGRLMTFVH